MNHPRTRLAAAFLLVFCCAPTVNAQGPWRTAQGKECKVRTDLPEAQAQAFAKRLDEFAAVFAEFYAGLGLVAHEKNALAAQLFSNFDDFNEFRERDGQAAGYRGYSSNSLNTVISYYDPKDASLASMIFGLSSNLYLRRFVQVQPEWLRVGIQCHFQGWDVQPGAPAQKALPLVQLVILQKALKTKEYIPLEQLLKRTPANFDALPRGMSKASTLLAASEAWGLVHYLLELAPEPERLAFKRYLKAINATNAKSDAVQLELGDWGEFEQRWSAALLALDAKCETAQDWMRIGDADTEVRDYAAAIAAYGRAFEKDPALPGVPYKTGYACKRAGDYARAIEWLSRAVQQEAKRPEPHYTLARVYTNLDWRWKEVDPPKADFVKALEHAKAAAEIAPQPMYLAFYARCQLLNGDKKSALATMKKAIDAADKDEKARYEKELAEIKQAKG